MGVVRIFEPTEAAEAYVGDVKELQRSHVFFLIYGSKLFDYIDSAHYL
jgi:hypothetical protein